MKPGTDLNVEIPTTPKSTRGHPVNSNAVSCDCQEQGWREGRGMWGVNLA